MTKEEEGGGKKSLAELHKFVNKLVGLNNAHLTVITYPTACHMNLFIYASMILKIFVTSVLLVIEMYSYNAEDFFFIYLTPQRISFAWIRFTIFWFVVVLTFLSFPTLQIYPLI